MVLQALLTVVALIFPAQLTHAETIEGYTPSGQFRTVGLDSQGRFQVATDSGVAQHVIVDGGTLTVRNTPGTTMNVTGPGGGPISVAGGFTVAPSTAATMVTGCATMTGTAVLVYPADSARKQGFVYNTDSAITVNYAFTGGVSNTDPPLAPGGSIQPDTPSSYIGEIWFIGTAGARVCYAYFK